VSLVEFAIIFPFALVFVLGLIQAGLIYIGKINLNHATFMAARRGAVENGTTAAVRASVIRGLIPFYQDSTKPNLVERLGLAWKDAQVDAVIPGRLSVERLSPSPQAFNDFGVVINGKRQIPNDSLAFRNDTVRASSGVNIQDANLLKIRVTYAFELKVPLMKTIVRTMMCGGSTALQAFGGSISLFEALNPSKCLQYYQQGRIPLVSYAVVQMQSPAFE
jgi:hypothetical protein